MKIVWSTFTLDVGYLSFELQNIKSGGQNVMNWELSSNYKVLWDLLMNAASMDTCGLGCIVGQEVVEMEIIIPCWPSNDHKKQYL